MYYNEHFRYFCCDDFAGMLGLLEHRFKQKWHADQDKSALYVRFFLGDGSGVDFHWTYCPFCRKRIVYLTSEEVEKYLKTKKEDEDK